MGLYIRKSFRVGPCRINVSRSGFGASIGVKGLRIGAGPRGSYVHAGANGLYYRQSLNVKTGKRHAVPAISTPGVSESIPQHALGEEEEIESANVIQMVDASSANLLDELNSRRGKLPLLMPVILLFFPLLLVFQKETFGMVGNSVLTIAYIGACLVAYYVDTMRRSYFIAYEFDDVYDLLFQQLHDAFAELNNCTRVWHVGSHAKVLDSKYHAGAGTAVRRKAVQRQRALPVPVKSNVDVPMLTAGKQILAFFPDRLLVFDQKRVGAVSYAQLKLKVEDSRCVEDSLPVDATVVDHTWQYVNKKGGPDKRFRNNRQLPIALYTSIGFTSDTGLNELFLLSRSGVGASLTEAIRRLADRARNAQPASSPTRQIDVTPPNIPIADGFVVRQCPKCGHTLRIPPKYVGVQGKCKHCGNIVTL